MDLAPGRKRVHEHAETGKPLFPSENDRSPRCADPCAAYTLHQARGSPGAFRLRSDHGTRSGTRQRWNGPAGHSGKVPPQRRRPVAGGPGIGHKLSAIGLPQDRVRSAGLHHARFAAPRGASPPGCRCSGHQRFFTSAHPLPFRSGASPSHLAAVPGRQAPPGGKVRWQKRFAFPARRMKRGLRFLKTINSRKSTTNAKTSTPWQGRFTTAASPAFCPACSRPLSTLAWNATPSSM